jgi:hypothetical protein
MSRDHKRSRKVTAMDRTQPTARTTSWRWIAALWCAFGLIEATQAIGIMRFGEGRDHAWQPLFAVSLATWLPWALATPWIIGLARRHRLHRRMNVRTLVVHLAAFAIISVIAEAWSAVLQVMFNPWGNRVDIHEGLLNAQVLHLSVLNDGPNFPDEWQTTGAGVGLANLRTRLQILHGEASELRMTRVGTDGVEVVVTLPLRNP